MHEVYEQELLTLKNNTGVNSMILDLFFERLKSNPALTRAEDSADHFGSYCIPLNTKTKKIYIGHHKKSNLWLPPGGHIDKHESPKDAALREFSEELSYEVKFEPISLVNVDISTIYNPGYACRIHFDFWYVVFMDKEPNFEFSQREYFTAEWVTIPQLLKHNTLPHYITIYKNLAQNF
jgi:8-oxo-dGTP pyrophosphatase MutT (NUDIX family)